MIKKWKVLIIEDEETIRMLLSDILSEEGYEVITAKDGKEGLEVMQKEIPDIVLLDCQMPRMDGYETIKRIRENPYWADIPVIFLTVRSSESDQLKGIELGAEDYLVKPFNKNVLLAKMKMLVKRKEIILNINPLTKLPGNIMIRDEVEKRLLRDKDFSLLYIDLNNFKAFNDYYGFSKGDEVIKFTADILTSTINEMGEKDDFVGHIGGDDFVVITSSLFYKEIAEKIINKFDEKIKEFYNEEDRKRGYITTYDREGNLRNFPIMGISIVCVSSKKTKIVDFQDVSQKVSLLKKYAKQFGKSIFLEERRTE